MDTATKSCREFARLLASSAPTPGGGGAAALVGALAAALGSMVTNLTIGKKTYADVEGEMLSLRQTCDDLRAELLNLIEEDARGFAPLAEAYRLSKDAPNRGEILDKAALNAIQAPAAMVRACGRVIEAAEVLALHGSRLAVSDAGCAAVCAQGAMKSAALNVFINTKTLADRKTAEDINKEVNTLLDLWLPRAEAVYAKLCGDLGGR